MEPPAQQPATQRRQPGLVVMLRGHPDGFGLRRIGADHLGQLLQADAGHHRQRYLVDHLAGMSCDDGGAEYLVAAVTNVDLHEPAILAIENGAIYVMHRHSEGLDWNVAFARLSDVKTHVRDFRIRVGAPGNGQRAHSLAPGEERVANDEPARRVRRGGELMVDAPPPGRVAPWLGGSEKVVDSYTRLICVGDACGVEGEPVYHGHAACPDENHINRHCRDVTVIDQIDDLPVAFDSHFRSFGVEMNLYAISRQGVGHHVRGVTLFSRQEEWFGHGDDRSRAQAGERLRPFATARAATDHENALRQRRQLETFRGMNEPALGQAGNGHRLGLRAGRDHRFCEAHTHAAHVYRIGTDETSSTEVQIDAQVGQPRCRHAAADSGADAADAVHCQGEIEVNLRGRLDAEVDGVSHVGVVAWGPDDRFLRNRGVVQ